MKSLIRNPKKVKQVIDFSGLYFGKKSKLYPTDFDFVFDAKGFGWVLGEAKTKNAPYPQGQMIAIERSLNAHRSIIQTTKVKGVKIERRRRTMGFICSHQVYDTNKPVNIWLCKVDRVWLDNYKKWQPFKYDFYVVDYFLFWLKKNDLLRFLPKLHIDLPNRF